MIIPNAPLTSRPGALPTGLITLATRLLPPDCRDRFYDEFRADLCYLPWHSRTAHAGSLLLGALPLRRALQEESVSAAEKVSTAWECRLGRHRYRLVNDDNPENRKSSHLECVRCLKFKESRNTKKRPGCEMAA